MSLRHTAFAVAAALVLAASAVSPQERGSLAAEAVRHRDAGDFDTAARLFRQHLSRNPGDHETARLLAQTLYWAQRPDEARVVYEDALRRHPADVTLRLDYGRMLAELWDGRRAREVVDPLRRDPAVRGYAEALLGTIAYREGDLVSARRLLRSALRATPDQPEARRHLREIAAMTAPWIGTHGEGRSDDQPFRQHAAGAEAGWFITPLLRVVARGSVARLGSADSLALELSSGDIGLAHYLPAARLETELAAGVLRRDVSDTRDWIGRAGIGLRLPRNITIRLSGERAPYLYTVASLRTPVMTRTGRAMLALNSPNGWLGEAVAQRQWYPDTNAIGTVHAWLLVPLANGPNGRLQLGYAGAYQHADESRFTPTDTAESPAPGQPFPPWSPVTPRSSRNPFAGVYEPYYTPLALVTHSALGAVELRMARFVTLRASGSFGVAREAAPPELGATTGSGEGDTRTFFLWTARTGLELAPHGNVTLALSAEATQTPVYATAGARAQATWRFAGASARR